MMECNALGFARFNIRVRSGAFLFLQLTCLILKSVGEKKPAVDGKSKRGQRDDVGWRYRRMSV
jgi:hypothetical protein